MEPEAPRLRGAVAMPFVGAAALFAFELGRALVVDPELPAPYLALCAGLALAHAGVVAALCLAVRPLRRWAVPIWAASAVGLVGQGLDGVLALACFAGARRLLRSDARGPAVELAITVGALLWTLGLQPELPLPPAWAEPARDAPGIAVGLALALAGLGGLARLAPRVPPLAATGGAAAAIGLAWLAVAGAHVPSPPPVPAPGSADRPNVFLIVLDTVSARHVSLYGYERPTMPRLEARVRSHPGAAVVDAAYAMSPWTVPTHVSLLTGRLPSDHGAHYGRRIAGEHRFRMDADAYLPERLGAAGFRTIGVSAHRLDVIDGFTRGFDVFEILPPPEPLTLVGEALRDSLLPGLFAEVRKRYPPGPRVTREALRLARPCAEGGCFVFMNYLDAHAPYLPEDPRCRGRFGGPWGLREEAETPSVRYAPEKLARLRDRYDEELCGLDHALGDLLDGLDAAGTLARSWVVVTADHGESFGDHGATEHGSSLFEEQVRVPLVILPPAGLSVEAPSGPVGSIDVAATVAAIGGVALPTEGRSLLGPAADRRVPLEFFGDPRSVAKKGALTGAPMRGVVSGTTKALEIDGQPLLFDLRADPREETNLSQERPDELAELAGSMPPLEVRQGDAGGADEDAEGLDAETREALRALGYVE